MQRIFLVRHAAAQQERLSEPLASRQIDRLRIELLHNKFKSGSIVRHSPLSRAKQTAIRVGESFLPGLIEEKVLGESNGAVISWAFKFRQVLSSDELWVTHEFVVVPLLQAVGLEPSLEETDFGCLFEVNFVEESWKKLI